MSYTPAGLMRNVINYFLRFLSPQFANELRPRFSPFCDIAFAAK